ncbi:MAG: chemotaxis protein CheD [Candidatus Binatia bacterium]
MNPTTGRTPQELALSTNAEIQPRTKHYLHPGELFASRESHAVTTILGSCVAVCLWEPEAKIGGINHYLLPTFSGGGDASARFGDVSIKELLARLTTMGCDRRRLQAKLFGGACVLEAFRERKNHLGSQNIRTARELLQAEAIPVVSEDVGGHKGRKLIFLTDDGSAWVKEL